MKCPMIRDWRISAPAAPQTIVAQLGSQIRQTVEGCIATSTVASKSAARSRCIQARSATLALDCVMASGTPCRVKSDVSELVLPRASAVQVGGPSAQAARAKSRVWSMACYNLLVVALADT